jgi:TRAP-type transport system periplasmic protein
MSIGLSRRAALAGAAAAGFTPRMASAGRRLVRITQSNAGSAPAAKGCQAFAAAVAADPVLGGLLRVDVYNNGALGDELAAITGCIDGSVDMALSSISVFSTYVPAVGLLDTPFLFKTAEIARAALDGEIGAQLAALLKPVGLNVQAWCENGLRQMTANRPIRRPADLMGLKLRVPQSDVEVASFRALGAEPGQLPYTALYEALRTGEFEAEENPIAIIEAGRLFEVQKFLSMTTHIYSASVIIASQDLLDDLSGPQRLALAACAKQGAAVTRVESAAAQRDGVARLRAAGMTVVDDVDIAAFIAASKPNMAALGQKYGADLMSQLIRVGSGV